jgi:hypothetical protein
VFDWADNISDWKRSLIQTVIWLIGIWVATYTVIIAIKDNKDKEDRDRSFTFKTRVLDFYVQYEKYLTDHLNMRYKINSERKEEDWNDKLLEEEIRLEDEEGDNLLKIKENIMWLHTKIIKELWNIDDEEIK